MSLTKVVLLLIYSYKKIIFRKIQLIFIDIKNNLKNVRFLWVLSLSVWKKSKFYLTRSIRCIKYCLVFGAWSWNSLPWITIMGGTRKILSCCQAQSEVQTTHFNYGSILDLFLPISQELSIAQWHSMSFSFYLSNVSVQSKFSNIVIWSIIIDKLKIPRFDRWDWGIQPYMALVQLVNIFKGCYRSHDLL